MFYLKKNGLIYGPYEPDVLRKKAAEGFFGPTDFVKKENGPWYSACKIKSFKFGAENKEPSDSPESMEKVEPSGKKTSKLIQRKNNLQGPSVSDEVVYEYLGEEEDASLAQEIDSCKPKSKKSKFWRKKKRSKWPFRLVTFSIFLGIFAVGGYFGIHKKLFPVVQLGLKEEGLPEPFELANNNKIDNDPANIKELKEPKNQAVTPPKPIPGFNKKFINIQTELVRYGYDKELGLYFGLYSFAKFGSLANSHLAMHGDPFEKGDALKRASEWRDKLRNIFFFTDKISLQFHSDTDFEKDGLVIDLKMPFKLSRRIKEYEKQTKLEGVVSNINCEDFDDGEFGFLRKDGKLQTCTGQEAVIVKKNDGILYVRESSRSSIKISLKGDKEILKAFYDNRGRVAVECGFSELEVGKALFWGYFRLDWLLAHKKNTDSAFIGFESGLINAIEKDRPNYFCFESEAAPEMILAKLLYLKVRDHRGVEIGSVFFND